MDQPTGALRTFQAFIDQHIPLVPHMQWRLQNINAESLSASAPLTPNINDKGTVFGGSSAALMTICGWSLIKFNLEQQGLHNDVVIHRTQIDWQLAQSDDLRLQARLEKPIDWTALCQQLQTKNRPQKINVHIQSLNQAGVPCSQMQGRYVILKQ
ncbi:YiiD C-terminal domain-containing protein [Marinicella meishanensis]|uniref:YiiD C-terminal domain-containing protein n=1 Tax=Marinicella meishanensis TaxID=2873263 RepID=UPI001CBD769D|nr:YiiD C-terminal domain-containing protein [Marinicella sp. NBU2979]